MLSFIHNYDNLFRMPYCITCNQDLHISLECKYDFYGVLFSQAGNMIHWSDTAFSDQKDHFLVYIKHSCFTDWQSTETFMNQRNLQIDYSSKLPREHVLLIRLRLRCGAQEQLNLVFKFRYLLVHSTQRKLKLSMRIASYFNRMFDHWIWILVNCRCRVNWRILELYTALL